MSRDARAALESLVFRKSSHSDPDRERVEVGHTAVFGLRDSKLADSPVLTVTAEHGRAFLSAVQTGRFDR